MKTNITAEQIVQFFKQKQFDELLDIQENEFIDFKSEPYILTPEKGKLEIAKDVSGFANAQGGIIVFGISTKKVENTPHEVSSGFKPIPQKLIDIKQYKDAIQNWIFPTPDVEINFINSPEDSTRGYFYIFIPKDKINFRQPFLVVRALLDDSKTTEKIFGYFSRKGDQIDHLSVEEIHQFLKDGFRFDKYLSEIHKNFLLTDKSKVILSTNDQIKVDEKVKIQLEPVEQTPQLPTNTAIPTALKKEKVFEERIHQALKAGQLDQYISYSLACYPISEVVIANLFDSRDSELVSKIRNPYELRDSGFDITVNEDPRIVNGEARRCCIKESKILEIWKDASIIYCTRGDSNNLCWGNYSIKQYIKINPIALVESIYLFAHFIKDIYSLANIKACEIKFILQIQNIPLDFPFIFQSGPIDSYYFSQAPEENQIKTSEVKIENQFFLPSKTPDEIAYDMIVSFYRKHAYENDAIPYVDHTKKIIDIEKIKKR